MKRDPHSVRDTHGRHYDDVWWYETEKGMEIVVRGKPGEETRTTVIIRWRDLKSAMGRMIDCR